jgi:pilus assembly protein CpaE
VSSSSDDSSDTRAGRRPSAGRPPKGERDERKRRRRRRERAPNVDPQRSVLLTRMEEAEQKPRKARRRRSRHSVGLFFSCHGGNGTTTIATHVGALLASRGKRTCLLDLDLQFGDALAALNLRGRCPLSEVATEKSLYDGDRLDPDLFLARLPRHASGLFVLSQVGHVDGLSEVGPDKLPGLLRQIRRCFDVVLIDGIRDFNDVALAALDVTDRIALVTAQDVPSLRGLVMRLEIFKRLGYSLGELNLLVSRFSKRAPIPLDAIAASVQLEPRFVVEDDFKLVHKALSDGHLLTEVAPRAQVTQDLIGIVEDLFGVPCTESGKGLLGRLLGVSG